MSDQTELAELQAYLLRTTRLTPAEAARVIDDVLAFLDETAEQYVRRRHLALQAEGLANAAIFERLRRELPTRRFRAPALTVRQLRRMIYG